MSLSNRTARIVSRSAARSTTALTFVLAASMLQPGVMRASDPGTADWPMWGGTPDRNMVSNMKDLPVEWDVKARTNVKWVADLGSQSYGNPVIAGGMVFVGIPSRAATAAC
jgi:hypothetical protein